MAETKHERLDADRREKMEYRVGQVSMGYDTGTLARIYTQDVKYLLKEIELLTVEVTSLAKIREGLVSAGCEPTAVETDPYGRMMRRFCELQEEVEKWKEQTADVGSRAAEEAQELARRVESAENQIKFQKPQYDVPRQLIEDMRAEPQKPSFDWPWVVQAGTPAECMEQCLTALAKIRNITESDGDREPDDKADQMLEDIEMLAQEPLVLFGDPLAPQHALGSMTIPPNEAKETTCAD